MAVATQLSLSAIADRLVKLQNDRDRLDRQLESDNRTLEFKQGELSRLIEPIEPMPADVHSDRMPDRRLTFAMSSSGGIFFVFGGLVLYLALSQRQGPYTYEPFDDEPSAESNGEAQASGNGAPVNGESREQPAPAALS